LPVFLLLLLYGLTSADIGLVIKNDYESGCLEILWDGSVLQMNEPSFVCPLPDSKSRQNLIRSGVDNFSGCYAVFSLGKCLYVGRSRHVLTRVFAHYINQRDGHGVQWRLSGMVEWYFRKPFAPFGSVLWTWETEDFWDLENDLIGELDPSHNFGSRREHVR